MTKYLKNNVLGRFPLAFGLVAIVLLISACELPGPHVHDPNRFDRDSQSYGQDPEDINDVTICYNSSTSTPKMVADLAKEQCGRFRKTAVFVRQHIDDCPLANPISAEYACKKDDRSGSLR